MPTLEVFFDYACPFCKDGHAILMELAPLYPNMAIEWIPCEAHPRPDRYGPHSDLCARGYYFAKEHKADLLEYHKRMYHATFTQQLDIEKLEVITGVVDGLLDTKLFYEALVSGQYEDKLLANNRLVWETIGFYAVPSYRFNDKLLKLKEEDSVSKVLLKNFIEPNLKGL